MPSPASPRQRLPIATLRPPIALFALFALTAAPAVAQTCQGDALRMIDGRVLGHLPYGDASPDVLAELGPGLSLNGCTLHRDAIPDLLRLLAAANSDPAVQGRLYALSCYRSIARQQSVFCREHADGDAAANFSVDRAISVAPPGYSEHGTGYALDFAVRPRLNDCPDAEACMAASPGFRWLVANAPKFGFEMSFPISNRQNVKWEPWHWRWVGVSAYAPGAMRARALFARARGDFPASPAVVGLTLKLLRQPPVPAPATPPKTPAKKRR